MRHCKKQRHPFDHLTRTSMVDWNKRQVGKDRELIAGRSARATKDEVRQAPRATWRNWEFCMSRVCNSQYHY